MYKGRSFADKIAVLPSQVRKKMQYMMGRGEHLTIDGATIILAELFGVLLGLRRAEHFASAQRNPDKTTLLCFKNLAGIDWDLGDTTQRVDIGEWAARLTPDEIIRVRLCYTKHQRHRVAHEVIAGPGYKLMSLVTWLKIVVRLRIRRKEKLTIYSPILVRVNRGRIVPMTGAHMASMDRIYGPVLGWGKATLHSRRRGFATAAVRCGLHMALITIAMRHSQGVTLQYVSLSLAEKAATTTRLAVASYSDRG